MYLLHYFEFDIMLYFVLCMIDNPQSAVAVLHVVVVS
jgi:hypothetical protein